MSTELQNIKTTRKEYFMTIVLEKRCDKKNYPENHF